MPALPSSSTPAAADLPPVPGPGQPLQRSGAVARLLGMPVATLRVWERRHGLTRGALTPGGQRLYTAEDVRRLALIRQLAAQGHAIGSLAGLGLAQLQQVAASAVAATVPASRPWRLGVVGPVLGARLQRPALLRRLGRSIELIGPFDGLAQAQAAYAAMAGPLPVDAWLLHQPQLHAGWLADLEAFAPELAPGPGRPPLAVCYGLAPEAVCQALADRGVALLREPQPDTALAQWLRLWTEHAAAGRVVSPSPDVGPGAAFTEQSGSEAPPRRWDDAALTGFASLASSVACDCPRHLAELLLQIAAFEAYSAQCAQASPADAALHTHLGREAAAARARLELALDRLARHEGLPLPA